MGRSWTWIDENIEHTDADIELLTPRLDALASEWSAISDAEEQRGFRRMAEIEDGEDYEFEDDEERVSFERDQRSARELVSVRLEIIEEMMARYNARIMRPYEHWNEDERFMEYQETRYDY